MMTAELTALGLAAILQALQIGISGVSMNRDVGAEWNAGPRDTQPTLSPLTGRLRRAVDNHFQGLAIFTIAVVLVTISGQSTAFTRGAAWAYLAARMLYVPAYAYGWTPWRSLIWGVGFLASLAMIVSALI